MNPVVLLPGPYGDIIQCLPAFRLMATSGPRPLVVVAEAYVSVLDGVSYVVPQSVRLPWTKVVAEMRPMFPNAIAPQFWNEQPIESVAAPRVITLCRYGQWFMVDLDKDPDYGTAMWRRLGFDRATMLAATPYFDRRDQAREDRLVSALMPGDKCLLYNFKGTSSPFPCAPEVVNTLHRVKGLRLVDLSSVLAYRIYDLLGLFDRALGVVTSDTATLHLAAASRTPYAAFTRDGWLGSVPRGNCRFQATYSDSWASLPRLLEWVAGLAKTFQPA